MFTKNQARHKVAKAIEAGSIVRPKLCEYCDAHCKPQGHHYDYQQPLDVTWLCQNCHTDVHHPKLTSRLAKIIEDELAHV